ncbi:MAG: hypothetical protein SGJ17_03165 [Hyphomicrobiales bacterium]|nr:hypothetical protein [Hyphomicrobiales bacterium]
MKTFIRAAVLAVAALASVSVASAAPTDKAKTFFEMQLESGN